LRNIIRLVLSTLLLAGVLSATFSIKPVSSVESISEAKDRKSPESAPLSPQVQLQEGYYQSPLNYSSHFPLESYFQTEFTFNLQRYGALVFNSGFANSRTFIWSLHCLLNCIQAQAP